MQRERRKKEKGNNGSNWTEQIIDADCRGKVKPNYCENKVHWGSIKYFMHPAVREKGKSLLALLQRRRRGRRRRESCISWLWDSYTGLTLFSSLLFSPFFLSPFFLPRRLIDEQGPVTRVRSRHTSQYTGRPSPHTSHTHRIHRPNTTWVKRVIASVVLDSSDESGSWVIFSLRPKASDPFPFSPFSFSLVLFSFFLLSSAAQTRFLTLI